MRTMIGIIALSLIAAILVPAHATPIRPDVKKMLANPQPTPQFPPARAGWNGPETPPTPQAAPNPTLERIGPTASAREARESLKSSSVAGLQGLAALLLGILLLRRIRSERRGAEAAAPVPSSEAPEPQEISRAA